MTSTSLVALVLAVMMLLVSSVAFAADYKIEVNTGDTHSYKVYQILKGTLSTDGKTLSDASWGDNVIAAKKSEDVNTVMKTFEGLSDNALVEKVAEYVDLTSTEKGIVKADQAVENLAPGYYVMVDVTNPLTNTDEDGNVISSDTKALNVIMVVNNVKVTKKWSTATDDKIIETDTLAKDTGTNSINKKNDNVSIGDTVNYLLTATVPDNADKFKAGTFFYVITDKLSSGLTFTENSIAVYADGKEEANKLDADKYTVKYKPNTSNDNTFEIGIKNAADYKGKTLYVRYSAVLNENAIIGDAGNPNESTAIFSNDPNKKYDGSPEDTNNPGFPDSTSDVPMGVTPKVETWTYTTGIEVQKIDENGEPLTGATFEVSGQSAKKVVTKTETFEVDDTDGTYYKLKNGTYTMTAPTTENTMVAAESGATKGYVVDAEATGDDVIEIDSTKYRPVKAGETPTHILKVGSKDAYADSHKYKKTVTQKSVDDNVTDHKMSEAVDGNGLARFDGLGAGTYTVKETVTPNGYNTIPQFDVKVTYNEDGTSKFTTTSENVTYEDGIFKVRVVNKKGATLPETGGIGTTIFYVAGSILVLAAAILLITKRRMGAGE